MSRSDRYSNEGQPKHGRDSGGKRTTVKEKKKRFIKLKLILVMLLILAVGLGILKIVMYVKSISRVHLTDEGLTHNERYSDFIKVHGIDVSEHQDDINWKKVKSSEADFAFIRAGYRSAEDGTLHEDADFRENMKHAKKAGVMTGVYFYSQALDEKEAEEEAEYLLDLVKRYDVDLQLVIDYEFYPGGRLEKKVKAGEMPASSMYHDVVLAFCRKVEKEGYESAVYANYNMLTNYMDSSLLDDEAVIWAAQYGGSCDVNGDYLYWQCAEDAAIDGIEGGVDHDIWYIKPDKVYPTTAKAKKNAVSIGECELEFDKTSYKMKNHLAKPKVTVTYDGKKLRKGRDYNIGFVRNSVSGTGYAIVRGMKRYKGWTAVPFTVE